MAIDFDATVLAPCFATFGVNFTFTAPGGSPFTQEGIIAYKDADVALEDGTIVSTTEITLGIRLSQFPSIPAVGWTVSGPKGAYTVDKVRPDGQGGVSLLLKALQPVPATG